MMKESKHGEKSVKKASKPGWFLMSLLLLVVVLAFSSVLSIEQESVDLTVMLERNPEGAFQTLETAPIRTESKPRRSVEEVFPPPKFNPPVPEIPQKARKPSQTRWPIRVGLYTGLGTTERSRKNLAKLLTCGSNSIKVIKVTKMSRWRVNREKLDVMLVPGGVSSGIRQFHKKQNIDLKKVIHNFLKEGGGFLGVCAGAFMARQLGFSPFLNEVRVEGMGYITQLNVSQWFADQALYPVDSGIQPDKTWMFFVNGPVFSGLLPKKSWPRGVRNPQVIMKVGSDGIFHRPTRNKTHADFQNLGVIVTNQYYKGRVVIITGHPETDPTHGVRSDRAVIAKCDMRLTNIFMSTVYLSASRSAFPPTLPVTSSALTEAPTPVPTTLTQSLSQTFAPSSQTSSDSQEFLKAQELLESFQQVPEQAQESQESQQVPEQAQESQESQQVPEQAQESQEPRQNGLID